MQMLEEIDLIGFRVRKVAKEGKKRLIIIPVIYQMDIERWGLDRGFDVTIRPLPRGKL